MQFSGILRGSVKYRRVHEIVKVLELGQVLTIAEAWNMPRFDRYDRNSFSFAKENTD